MAVRQADVLAGGDDDASGDEANVFARVQHLCQPVDGGIGITGADGFDESARRVVVRVAIAIIDYGFCCTLSSAAARSMTMRPSGPAGVESTASSRAFRHLRASPSQIVARCRLASGLMLALL